MILTAYHPSIETGEISYLASAVAAGATSLVLKSVKGFSTDDYIVIGKLGAEKTEIVKITSVTAATNTIGFAALGFGHGVDAPAQVIKHNQIKFYKSATLTGTYNLIATVDIDADDKMTRYDYAAGLATDYFKVSYYNSTTATESAKSDPLLGTGYSRKALASLLKEIRIYVGTKPTDEELIMAINTGQEVICGMDDRWFFMHKSAPITVPDDSNEGPLPADFLTLDRVQLLATSGTITTKTKLTFYTQSNFETKYPSVDTAVKALPTTYTINEADDTLMVDSVVPDATEPAAYTIKMYYWSKPTPLVEYTDETVIPNPSILVFWVASKIEASKHNTDTSSIYWQEFSSQMKAITNRRKGGEKNFSIGG